MFAKCEVNQYFPSCVWAHELNDFATMNSTMIEALYRLRAEGTGHGGAERAWQSAGDLHQQAAFQPLTKINIAAAKGVLDFLKCRYQGFEITNCWGNINKQGESHHVHTHPNNFLSGVYYLRAPEKSGDIVFSDPRHQALVLIPSYQEFTPFNSARQRITPREGTLLLFHSWFQHQVEGNESEEERISISFNVMLKGDVGQQSGGARF